MIGMVAIMVAAMRRESGVMVMPDLALDIWADVVAPVLYWFRISTRMDCMGFTASMGRMVAQHSGKQVLVPRLVIPKLLKALLLQQ